MTEIKLTVATVTLRDALTWGQQEELESLVTSGFRISNLNKDTKTGDIIAEPKAMMEAKLRTVEFFVEKIVDNDGKTVKYTKDWAYNLTKPDGDTLMDAIDKLTGDTPEEEKKSDTGVDTPSGAGGEEAVGKAGDNGGTE